ncbi:hypothetical protein KOR42_28960 [Thalassoglobus neptunius]|uniref:Glycosyltransferase RgtA/B/C/D-like domain-containing protein n=2 Tax=Thalassoglobus neptunius TaxID=1938619 RepID=A0A5C5WYB9_9PLAN|nr:hypothetical protein KOR42_28960 [Thalassoglobus neptunius]
MVTPDLEKMEYQTSDGKPNVAVLTDRTPDALKLSGRAVLLTSAISALFLILNYTPLWHTDLWGHLGYGRWIAEHGQLPETEPLMPLAEGVRIIDTAWFGQYLGFRVFDRWGPSGIQFLYGLCIAGCAALVSGSLYRRTGQVWIALFSVFLLLWIEYQQIIIVRPQLGGMFCFALVFVLATTSRWRKWTPALIAGVFVIWANVHGSFLVGLAMLGALTVGRFVDVLKTSRSFKLAFSESRVRQLLYAFEFSAVACLVNPYGIGIYGEVLAISSNANLESLIEWEPLTFRMKQGQAAACLATLLIFAYRMTPRRITVGEILLLFGLGGATLWISRFIVWWGIIAAYYFGLHASAIWRVWINGRPQPAKRSGGYAVACLGLIWIGFAYTPFGGIVIHGPPKDPERVEADFRKQVSKTTPIDAAEYLREHPPVGQIFNIYEWGDYLLWAGPKDLQVFVASHAHLIPEEIWQDYLEISRAGANWSTKLDRYGVNTIVLYRSKQAALIQRLEAASEKWKQVYIDDRAVIFERLKPITDQTAPNDQAVTKHSEFASDLPELKS